MYKINNFMWGMAGMHSDYEESLILPLIKDIFPKLKTPNDVIHKLLDALDELEEEKYNHKLDQSTYDIYYKN